MNNGHKAAIVVASFIVAGTIALGGGVALADDGDPGSGLGVTVIDDPQTPTPTPQPSSTAKPPTTGGSGSGGNSGGGGGGSTPPSDTMPVPTPSATPTGAGLDGWIVVSGLDSAAQAELNPFAGWVHVAVGVTNRSKSALVSGSVVFRMYTLFGSQIGPSVTQQLTRITPGDTRTSSATLSGVGQWTFVRVSAEFTPKGAADDAAPIVRETWVFAFPWLLIVIGVVAGAAMAVVRLRTRFRPQLGDSPELAESPA